MIRPTDMSRLSEFFFYCKASPNKLKEVEQRLNDLTITTTVKEARSILKLYKEIDMKLSRENIHLHSKNQ
jgi:hypothetical protein